METVMGNIDIELYDDVAPNTVANFIDYSTGGLYDNSIIHRSEPGFVIQGGGYMLNSGQVEHIPENDPVVNEFSLSNLRGTIAMAKLPGDPDSATSEWFFNLGDNSGNLDTQNGGFTVFGRVLGDGMQVVDSIAALPRVNAGGVFSALPVRDYADGPLADESYVFVNRVVLPRVAVLSSLMDFGVVGVGQTAEVEVRILNQGGSPLSLGNLAGTDPLGSPFEIVSGADNCSNQVLAAGEVCVVLVRFSPTSLGEFGDSFDVPSDDSETPYVQVRGAGSHPASLSPSDQLQMGSVGTGASVTKSVIIENVGGQSLTLYSIQLTGADQQDFMLDYGADCNVLASGATCEVDVIFMPQSDGSKTVQLEIETDFSEQSGVSLQITGSGSGPNLGVSSRNLDFGDVLLTSVGSRSLTLINGGGADLVINSVTIGGEDSPAFRTVSNNCSILVSQQQCSIGIEFDPQEEGIRNALLVINSNDPDTPDAEVALVGVGRESWNEVTLASGSGNVVLRSPEGTSLTGVSIIDVPSPEEAPADLSFDYGVYEFNLQLPLPGGATAVSLTLPEGVEPSTYYMYGATPDNAVPHWYEFLWDGQTGTGAVIEGNLVMLYLRDGKRGDSDLQANGVIVDPGAPGFSPAATGSEGSGSAAGGGGGCVLGSSSRGPGDAGGWFLLMGFVTLLGAYRRLSRLIQA
ncbi:peptidyl-prolyl cis-trans isomerase [Thiohalobacter thiocyanaticus]|uniref:peptidylprolyl isomerase n=2 Tax=Thiohalobacter thiocyanaticus TaxID=585455 RepID=A0A1Z4VNK0_9GAMM|nr:peptidyl-prolyl cis-trans isomerase [Thiohalobacter thiocyanaticus]